jgi:SPP1 family predicted phage head-tail adaptor
MLPRKLSTGNSIQPAGAKEFKINILYGEPWVDASGAPIDPATLSPPQTNVFATNIWASIKVLQGRELDRAQRVVAEVTHDVCINYRAGVKSGMLVQFRDRTFRVMDFQDYDENRVNLHLFCVEHKDGVE